MEGWWPATAWMVVGKTAGTAFAKARGLNALFIMRSGRGMVQCLAGLVFASGSWRESWALAPRGGGDGRSGPPWMGLLGR